MAISSHQIVRTTAYTHSEADHLEYGARNAMGGRLKAASRPVQRAEVRTPADDSLIFARLETLRGKMKKAKKVQKGGKKKSKPQPPRIGSAAAYWSRWPAGTTFRLLSTGQTYRVEDYGWALAGRNTIDLYMGNQRDMNNWGVRTEPIQVLKWGSREESLRILVPRQSHKHVRRMVLQLQGQHQEAAALE